MYNVNEKLKIGVEQCISTLLLITLCDSTYEPTKKHLPETSLSNIVGYRPINDVLHYLQWSITNITVDKMCVRIRSNESLVDKRLS